MCASPEYAAMKNLEVQQNRQTQERISAQQSELKHEMEDIERRFENMMEDLRLSRQLDELCREEFWDIHISESERAYQQERAHIKASSQQRDAVIHAEVNKMKQAVCTEPDWTGNICV